MDKEAIRECILRILRQEIEEWLEEEPGISDPFQYAHRLPEVKLNRKMG